LAQIISNSASTKETLPFNNLLRRIIQLFRGVNVSRFLIIHLLLIINVSRFGIIHLFQRIIGLLRGVILSRFLIIHLLLIINVSRFGIIRLLRRNILPRQRINYLFPGQIHSLRGINLPCYGRLLSLSEIKPSLFRAFSSIPTNPFDLRLSKR
jgi:hypothetical protein